VGIFNDFLKNQNRSIGNLAIDLKYKKGILSEICNLIDINYIENNEEKEI